MFDEGTTTKDRLAAAENERRGLRFVAVRFVPRPSPRPAPTMLLGREWIGLGRSNGLRASFANAERIDF